VTGRAAGRLEHGRSCALAFEGEWSGREFDADRHCGRATLGQQLHSDYSKSENNNELIAFLDHAQKPKLFPKVQPRAARIGR